MIKHHETPFQMIQMFETTNQQKISLRGLRGSFFTPEFFTVPFLYLLSSQRADFFTLLQLMKNENHDS